MSSSISSLCFCLFCNNFQLLCLLLCLFYFLSSLITLLLKLKLFVCQLFNVLLLLLSKLTNIRHFTHLESPDYRIKHDSKSFTFSFVSLFFHCQFSYFSSSRVHLKLVDQSFLNLKFFLKILILSLEVSY